MLDLLFVETQKEHIVCFIFEKVIIFTYNVVLKGLNL